MDPLRTQRRVTVLFYILVAYVILQFSWWAYLLIDLSRAHYAPQGAETVRLKIWMVAGEGAVFLTFLLAGIYITHRTISREIALARQQRNFLLSITHELKTPLAGIKLALQTLQKRGNLPAEKRWDIEKNALANTERLHALINNVLLATRIESGGSPLLIEETDLSALTAQIADQFKGNQTIHSDIQPQITVNTDVTAYTSIVVNLLENAMKYGGDQSVFLVMRGGPKEIEVSVEDRGPGISDGEVGRIFDMFYRSGNEETRNKKGTGLGLYIVRELTSAMGGRIQIDRPEKGGAKFRVFLPREIG